MKALEARCEVTPDRVRLFLNLPVMPAVRMTQRGKWVKARARDYMENRAALREAMVLVLARTGSLDKLPYFPSARVGFASQFYFDNPQQLHARDLDNLEKALQDTCKGVLFKDDNQIYERGVGGKFFSNQDGVSLEVWRLPDA